MCKAAKLTLTVSLSTPQEYRWVSDELSGKIDEMLGGNIAMDQYLIPGRGGKGGELQRPREPATTQGEEVWRQSGGTKGRPD